MGIQQNNQRQSPIEAVQQQNENKLLVQQPMSPSDKQQLQVNTRCTMLYGHIFMMRA